MDYSFSVFIEASHQIEGVVGEKASSVEGFGNQMCNRLGGGLSLNFVVIDFQLGLQNLDKTSSTRLS